MYNQRAEGRLSAAADAEVESAAIKDEKEEWALVFARAVEDGKKQVGGQQVGEQEEREAPRPTPLVALRLLLESQEERSLSVKVCVSGFAGRWYHIVDSGAWGWWE